MMTTKFAGNSLWYNYKYDFLILFFLMSMIYIPILSFELFGIERSVSRALSSLIYILPICFLCVGIKNKWVYVFFSGLLMLFSVIEMSMIKIYGCYVAAGNILSIYNTTSNEAGGFIVGNYKSLFFSIPIIACWIVSLYFRYKSKKINYKANLFLAVMFMLFSVLFVSYVMIVKWEGNINVVSYLKKNVLERHPYNVGYQFYQAYSQLEKRKYITEADNMSFGAKRPEYKNKEIYVLAVGESLKYENLSIGGYKRETTPLLASLDNLILCPDYYSTANITMYSVPQILTRATVNDFDLNYKEKSIFKPYKECGFKTFVICAGNLLCENTYKYLSTGCDSLLSLTLYDDDKISEKIDSLSSIYSKTFFVVQFMGNHSPYENFQKEQNVYRPNPVYDNVGWDNHSALVNAYDNTILYSDLNIYNIIKAIDKDDVQSGFIMVSDHGVDYNNGAGDHGRSWNPQKSEYHVPLFFWYSDVWGKNHNKKKANFIKNKKRPINADNVFYTVCDMADITIHKNYSKKQWSLFCDRMENHERYLLLPDGITKIQLQ